MLRTLRIEDFVLIDEVAITFGPGFTVLTGETGAGKSIIVSALQLLLGGRGDATLVRRGADRARLEATFDATPPVVDRLAAEGLDDDAAELILRREITADGRSRCWVNGRAVTVATLADVTAELVELHGQFADQPILRGRGPTDLVDDFGNLGDQRREYETAYQRWQKLRAEVEDLKRARAERAAALDVLDFKINELASAQLQIGEEEELREKRARVLHAARVAGDVEGALSALAEGDDAAAVKLAAARRYLADLAAVLPSVSPLVDRVAELLAATDDVAREVTRFRDAVAAEPVDADAIESRLALIDRLKKKYDRDVPALLAHLEELKAQRVNWERTDDRLAAAEAELVTAEKKAAAAARKLSASRQKAGRALAEAVNAALPALGIAGGQFAVTYVAPANATPTADGLALGAAGAEEARFDFTANPGEPLKPLAKTASGGELARVMLAVRAASAERAGAQTIIFDEVDAGIGGRVGHNVGERLRTVARDRQVICVTHLAQIAARADRQLFVEKEVREGRAFIRVAPLEGAARVEELARMLGGGKPPTPTTLRHAAELLATAHGRPGAR